MTARTTTPLKVLMFHGVTRESPAHAVYPGTRTCVIRERDFESCIQWCVRTHKIITLRDLPIYLDGESNDPAVLITFDDGLASVINLAVPVLKKYGITAVLFVTTGWIDAQTVPPIVRLESDLWNAPPKILTVRTGGHEFTAPIGTRSAIPAALADLWAFCFDRRVAPMSLPINSVRFDNRGWEPAQIDQEQHPWFPARWDQLAVAARAGVLEIGAHGVTHTPWSWLSAEERQREIGETRERLQHLTEGGVAACAYPHGMYDEASRAEVRKHYAWAFTTQGRPVGQDPVDQLPRFHVPSERPVMMDLVVRWPLMGRVLRKGASALGLQ